jgi:hypothetical protein
VIHEAGSAFSGGPAFAQLRTSILEIALAPTAVAAAQVITFAWIRSNSYCAIRFVG